MTNIIKYAKEHFIGFIFSILFGAFSTTALFYFTSSPTSSSEIKNMLKNIIRNTEPKNKINQIKNIEFSTIKHSSLDLSNKDSILSFGSYNLGEENIRFIAIFEPKGKSLIDKLVGRSGFYKVASISKMKINDPNKCLVLDANSIKIKDIDLDGNKEIILKVNNFYADSTSSTIIILKKDMNEEWHFLSPPTLKNILSERIENKIPYPEKLHPPLKPTTWFGLVEGKEISRNALVKKYKEFNINIMYPVVKTT